MHDEDRAGRAIKIMAVLQDATKGMVRPAADQIVERFGRDPYLVLTSCILSLRTKDTVSLPASIRLFERAQTPRDMLMLADTDIASVIYPVCFYRRKAATIRAISEQIIEKYDGLVPCNEKDLLLLPGVGRKTANLVLSQGLAFQQFVLMSMFIVYLIV
jgi:endonuclease-3